MVSAIVFIADGTEEMEFTIAYDTLVRAGASCRSIFVAAHNSEVTEAHTATCSRGVRIIADAALADLAETQLADILVIPGGAKGAETLSQNADVQGLVRRHLEENKIVGMICAGSLAAKSAGLPKQPLTSHPSVKAELEKDYDYREDPVVVSGDLVTSRGPGTAFPFALKLVELAFGADKRAEVEQPMVF